MKNNILIISLLFLMSCKVRQKPEFIKVNSVKIVNASLKNFTVKTDLQFKNINSVGGTLQATNIHVFIDAIDVATINSKKFKVPKKSEFNIPLEVKIPFSKIYTNNKQHLLEQIMSAISTKKVTILYQGKIRYELGQFHFDYPLEYQQKITFKK